ncbi:MAG: protein-disulfide isomerase [Parcubacteria group bacterium Gr01-1014_13]|nr:MAG: protein-disulfide isomerase [Parcubacteria group bacterium Gr01-1014_13]
MPNHKKLYLLLLAMVALAGIFFYRQIMRARQITVVRTEAPLISPSVIFIPTSESEQTLGNPGANIIVTEFVDIGCARCLSLHSAMKQFVIKHPQDIRLVWKDNVKPGILSDHTLAHQAAYCAGKQNKFWQFLDIAAGQRNNLAEAGLKKIALNLNLNIEVFWLCTNSPETKQAIADSSLQASQLGVRSLPAIFVNNKMINTDKDINIEEMLTNFIVKP